jgi:hypothetical protein
MVIALSYLEPAISDQSPRSVLVLRARSASQRLVRVPVCCSRQGAGSRQRRLTARSEYDYTLLVRHHKFAVPWIRKGGAPEGATVDELSFLSELLVMSELSFAGREPEKLPRR